MSAYMVHTDTIDLLVTVAIEGGPHDRELRVGHGGGVHVFTRKDADTLGCILVAANRESVNYRYTEDDIEDVYAYNGAGIPAYLGGPVIPWGDVLRAIDCYEYQSCEHPEWAGSLAAAICNAIRGKVCDRIAERDNAPWGWTREDSAKRRAVIRDRVNGGQ